MSKSYKILLVVTIIIAFAVVTIGLIFKKNSVQEQVNVQINKKNEVSQIIPPQAEVPFNDAELKELYEKHKKPNMPSWEEYKKNRTIGMTDAEREKLDEKLSKIPGHIDRVEAEKQTVLHSECIQGCQ